MSRFHKYLYLAFFVSALGLPPATSYAAEAAPVSTGWSRVTEGKISVYTQSETSQAASLIHAFNNLRDVLAQASAIHPDQSAALNVIAFHSQQDFNQYRLNAGSCAFYQQTNRGEYIVLPSLEGLNRGVSFHEFTHFAIAHSGLSVPLWLNEGLADFYSTFRVAGGTVTFGDSVPGRRSLLRSATWLPLASLFDVSTKSSYYSDSSQMALFYSESWALTHMLAASPFYKDEFPHFLRTLRDGHSAEESLRLTYQKSLKQVEQDLHDYLDIQHLPVIESRLELTTSNAAASLADVSDVEMDVNLAELSQANPNTRASLENRLASASSQLPESADAEEALGYINLRQGKAAEARAHFRAAIDRHSSDPNVLFYLGHLDHEAGAPPAQVLPLLERAIALKPDLNDARLELALVAAADGQYARAIENLQRLNSLRPQNAYAAAYTEAYCYAYTDQPLKARTTAQRAILLALTDRDRAGVARLVDFIDQQHPAQLVAANR